MSVYSGSVVEIAAKPFDVIADRLSIAAERLRREYHILERAFDQMVTHAKLRNIAHRTAAMAIGVEKIRVGKNTRGFFP